MKRVLLFCIVVVMSCPPLANAQDWAKQQLEKSNRHKEWVTIKNGNRNIEAFVVYPEATEKKPVVLVIHEIYGMTEWVQSMADQIAAAGYIAIAPDLLSGAGPNGGRSSSFGGQDKAMEAVSKLDSAQITSDLNATADYALKLPSASTNLFVSGFCWGGGQSFRFATNRQDLSAAFVFYGPPPEKEAMAKINAPIFAFYAGTDERINATLPDTKAAMKAQGKIYEPVLYDASNHGFMRLGEAPDAKEGNVIARVEAKERMEIMLKKFSKAK